MQIQCLISKNSWIKKYQKKLIQKELKSFSKKIYFCENHTKLRKNFDVNINRLCDKTKLNYFVGNLKHFFEKEKIIRKRKDHKLIQIESSIQSIDSIYEIYEYVNRGEVKNQLNNKLKILNLKTIGLNLTSNLCVDDLL